MTDSWLDVQLCTLTSVEHVDSNAVDSFGVVLLHANLLISANEAGTSERRTWRKAMQEEFLASAPLGCRCGLTLF